MKDCFINNVNGVYVQNYFSGQGVMAVRGFYLHKVVKKYSFFVCSLTLTVFLTALSSAAYAGDPIMPLGDVQPGMKCTARSVLRGVDVTTFDAEVVDIVGNGVDAGGVNPGEPLILVRFSGAAVDQTGVGPGFSGSPVYCPGADGQNRIIGILAYSIGDYGGKLSLLTPIERVIGTTVDPPKLNNTTKLSAKTQRLLAHAHPLKTPLTIAGVHPALAAKLQGYAKRAKQPLIVAPVQPRSAPADPPPFVPGSAVAVAFASGSMYAGGIGTVAYVDGNSLWAFGHSLDAIGPRSLFIQSAYVYGIIGNPINVGEISTYKLASPYGNVLGTLTNDGLDAISGKLGQTPPTTKISVDAQDDTGRKQQLTTEVADETDTGQSIISHLDELTGFVFADSVVKTLNSLPTATSGRICFTLTVRELPKPVQICNSYADQNGGLADVLISTPGFPIELIQNYQPRALHITNVDAQIKIQRGYHVAGIRSIRGPRKVRRGQKVRLKVKVRPYRGQDEELAVSFRIPRHATTGRRKLQIFSSDVLSNAADYSEVGASGNPIAKLSRVSTDGPMPNSSDMQMNSISDLQAALKELNVYDGLYVTLLKPSQLDDNDEIKSSLLRIDSDHPRRQVKIYEAYRDENNQFAGQAGYSLTVTK